MEQIFPYANMITGVLVLIVGFGFHWLGQLISVLNWEFAERVGLQEKNMPPEYKVYEHGTAVADGLIGWIYGIAGVGLILGVPWAYKLAWIPGVVLIYHGLYFWFYTRNQIRAGYQLLAPPFRAIWFLANIATGALAVCVAWHGA